MTWWSLCVSCKIRTMCWDKHIQKIFPSKNILFISFKHEISAVVHSHVFLQTNRQTTWDRLTANHGTVGITCHLELYAAGYKLSRMCNLTVIHSLVTCSLLYFPQDFPLFVIIFVTFSTPASHGATKILAQCDWIRIELNDGRFIQRAPGWDTAALQTPISPPQHCNCSQRKYNPGPTFKQSM